MTVESSYHMIYFRFSQVTFFCVISDNLCVPFYATDEEHSFA